RHFTRGGDEGTGITHRFHVDDDAVRVWVAPKIIDQVAPTHVEHRADGHEGAETDVFAEAPIEDGGAKRSTLRDKSDVPRTRHCAGKGRVGSSNRTHDAEAVGTDDTHTRPTRRRQNLTLQFCAFGTALF